MIVRPRAINPTATPMDRPLIICGASTNCSHSRALLMVLCSGRGSEAVADVGADRRVGLDLAHQFEPAAVHAHG
eukprot:390-Eustigmatos_ZCMA.PRE.1